MEHVTPYQMCINNAKTYIKKHNGEFDPNRIDAFKFSEIIAICFCKTKEDVIADLVIKDLK
jgi:hypothetical protein